MKREIKSWSVSSLTDVIRACNEAAQVAASMGARVIECNATVEAYSHAVERVVLSEFLSDSQETIFEVSFTQESWPEELSEHELVDAIEALGSWVDDGRNG